MRACELASSQDRFCRLATDIGPNSEDVLGREKAAIYLKNGVTFGAPSRSCSATDNVAQWLPP
jgi:hypothetical protein